MRNSGLDEAQAGIKIAGRNINNLRYADDTTLMAESEEELKNLLMKEKSEKVGLKLNIQKTKIMASGPIAATVAAAKSLQSCLTLCNRIDGSPPGSPSLGFSRQEWWSGFPFPSPMHESENRKGSRSVVSNS